MKSLSKIKIHNIEDYALHSKWVKLSFCFSDYMREEERDMFINNNFEFKRFSVVGDAMKYYRESKDYPDIIIIDIDFTGLSATKNINKELEATRTRGADMVLFAIEHFGDREIVPFTGQFSVAETYRAIQQFKDFLDAIPKTTDKGKIEILVEENPKRLQNVAKRYFSYLTHRQRNRIQQLIETVTNKTVVLTTPLTFGEYTFKLEHLLLGWWDKETEKIKNVKSIVQNLLKATQRVYNFQGHWKLGNNKYESIWKEYLEADDKKKYHEVNYAAFNFLLECIYWNDKNIQQKKFEAQDGILSIDTHFFDINAMVTSLLKETYLKDKKWQVFKAKLIGRRVLLGWSHYYEGKMELDIIIGLLVNGNNTSYSSDLKNVLTTNLGLKKIRNKNVFETKSRLLPDEELWLKEFVPLLQGAFDFLYNIDENISVDIREDRYFLPDNEISNLDKALRMLKENTCAFTSNHLEKYTKELKYSFKKNININQHTQILSVFDNLK